MYVPSLYCSLVSVQQITAKAASVLFVGDLAKASKGGMELFDARKEGKMYIMNLDWPSEGNEGATVALPTMVSMRTWHQRMGHLNYDAL